MISSLSKLVAKGESQTLECKRSTGELCKPAVQAQDDRAEGRPQAGEHQAESAITTAHSCSTAKPLPRIEYAILITKALRAAAKGRAKRLLGSDDLPAILF